MRRDGKVELKIAKELLLNMRERVSKLGYASEGFFWWGSRLNVAGITFDRWLHKWSIKDPIYQAASAIALDYSNMLRLLNIVDRAIELAEAHDLACGDQCSPWCTRDSKLKYLFEPLR